MAFNFVRKYLSELSGRRKIYFLTENSYSAISKLKGHMISRQIQKLGYYSYVFDIKQEAESDYSKIKEIKNSLFVVLRSAILSDKGLFERLKKNGNKLIWDPADHLVKLKEREEIQMIDGVIWANRKCAEDVGALLPKGCHGAIIYHHWDPRCHKNHCKEYKLLFLGDPTPENISKDYVEHIKDLHVEGVSNTTDMNKKDLFVRALNYSCHFSVREENTDSFKYKPNAKLSFASGYHANIILSRDCSNIELVDERYPYFTNSRLDSVLETVRHSKETYGSKIWDEGLEMLKEVREKTSIERISRDYIEFLTQF